MSKLERLCSCGCEVVLTGRQRMWATEACRKIGNRDAHLRKTFNITLAEFNAILEFQGGCCAICKRKPKAGETFVVDHEHDGGPQGPVRGILCNYCNVRILGRLKSAEKARNMASYLDNPPATQALGRVVIANGRPKKKRTYRKRKKR